MPKNHISHFLIRTFGFEICFDVIIFLPLFNLMYFSFVAGLLFHRAVLMSGSGLSPWSLVADPSKYAALVATHANCSPGKNQVNLWH